MNKERSHIESKEIKSFDTFVILKPLGTQEPVRSAVIQILKQKAEVLETITVTPTRDQMYELYKPNGVNSDGTPKPYFIPMLEYFEGKEVELILLKSNNDAKTLLHEIDELIGFWDPNKSRPGEIRHLMKEHGLRYDLDRDYDNLIHSPSSLEDMQREISIFLM